MTGSLCLIKINMDFVFKTRSSDILKAGPKDIICCHAENAPISEKYCIF